MNIIAFDLDGTAFKPYTSELSNRLLSDLKKLIDLGHIVVPATGRMKNFIPDSIKKLEGVRYMITSNGAGVEDLKTGERIYEKTVSLEKSIQVINLLKSEKVYFEVYIRGNAIVEREMSEDTIEKYSIPKEKAIYINKDYIYTENYEAYLRENGKLPEKINILHISSERYKMLWQKIENLGGLALITSIPNNIEINAGGCNKGAALEALAKKLSVDRSDVMAAGDGGNDVEMLEYAGISVAMGNGIEPVKAAAKYITDTSENDGLAKAIEKYILKEI